MRSHEHGVGELITVLCSSGLFMKQSVSLCNLYEYRMNMSKSMIFAMCSNVAL